MTRRFRAILALAGLAAFVGGWALAVEVTRPPARLRATAGFATHDGLIDWIVLDDRGEAVGSETLPYRGAARAEATARLRVSFGARQPTLAALPRGDDELGSIVAAAKTGYGGAIELVAIDAPDARSRASALQRQRGVRASWLPTPGEAVRAVVEMTAKGEMQRHAVASAFRVLAGFALAAAIGIPFGAMLGSSRVLWTASNGIIQFLRPISPIAWLPIATLLIGGGDLAAIFLICIAAFFPIAVGTASAVGSVDARYLRAARNLGVTGASALRRVTLPAALPGILGSLRIAVGISWVVVVAAEMLGVESGLGYLVLDARNQLRYDRVVAAMLVIGLIGILVDGIVRAVERDELERRGLTP